VFRSSDRRPTDEPDVSLERLSGRVHVLTERVDTLAQVVSTTAAATAKKDGEIALLRRELESGLRHAESAAAAGGGSSSSEIRELRDRIASLATERAKSSDEGRIAKLESKVALLIERVDTLASTVATTAAGLAGREGEIAALRRRLDESLPRAGSAAQDASLRKRIDDLGAATASASMRLESHATQIAALRDALDGKHETLESALALLAERVEGAERERATLAKSVADAAATRWKELERALRTLGERLDVLEHDRTKATSELARATSLWPAALRSLEARVSELVVARDDRAPAPIGAGMPSAPTAQTPAPQHGGPAQSTHDVERFLAEIRALEQRLESAAAASRQERDELRARLQRLETERSPQPEPQPLPVGADVLPFRGAEP
jgi:chromosome segregation ATPase